MTSSSWPSFLRGVIAAAVVRALTPPPDIPIWKWADEKPVWIQNEDAAEPGPYRSAKTPWTRRLQEFGRRPFMWVWSYQHLRWERIRVNEVNVQKSTQSGFTEAILNFIRWLATYVARNVIYLIDSQDQGKKIARRLLRSLKLLDPEIFTGDPDDLKSLTFLLRGMEVEFGGSFSGTLTAQKQAPVVVADEIEDHGKVPGDTSAQRNLKYRKKAANNGIQFNLSKPKLENGPINKLWKLGNREEFHIACPHCGHLQYFTYHAEEYDSPFADELMAIDSVTGEEIASHKGHEGSPRNEKDFVSVVSVVRDPRIVFLPRPLPAGQTRKVKTGRLVYEHCRDLFGKLDEVRVLRETYYECAACKGKIEEADKQRLVLEAAARDPEMLGWLPTAIGMPGVVSQRMSDLNSTDENSAWGQIVLEIHNARADGRVELQGVINNRLGNTWKEELNKTEAGDILANVAGRRLWFIDVPTERGYRRDVFESEPVAAASLARLIERGVTAEIVPSYCPPYKRGTIPFVPKGLVIGSDVGGNYARWVLIAAMENMIDAAVIDWADEIDPETIGEIMASNTWPCHKDGKKYRIMQGFIDAKFRKKEVLAVCWQLYAKHKLKLTPTSGTGGVAARGLRVWAMTPVNSFFHKGKGLKKLDINDREAKNDLYITCLNKKHRRVFFPVDLFDRDNKPTDPQLVAELCAEQLIPDRNGIMQWNEHPPDPNHYGDALKNALTGLRYLTRKHHRVREEE
jgi:hypothetical protein